MSPSDASHTGLEHDQAQRDLAFDLVGDSYHSAFGDIGMRGQHLFDGAGGEAMPSDVDDVVGAGHDPKIAILVLVARIRGQVVAGKALR